MSNSEVLAFQGEEKIDDVLQIVNSGEDAVIEATDAGKVHVLSVIDDNGYKNDLENPNFPPRIILKAQELLNDIFECDNVKIWEMVSRINESLKVADSEQKSQLMEKKKNLIDEIKKREAV